VNDVEALRQLQDLGFTHFQHSAMVGPTGQQWLVTHRVFQGGSGPSLLLMHELPGLSAACTAFALRLIARGFQVFMPQMIGPLLQDQAAGNLAKMCISREFGYLRSGTDTPVTAWLRDLARRVANEQQTRVGAIGMCLTGAFVILLIEPAVHAAVASQPGIPFNPLYLQSGKFGRGDWERQLNVSDAVLDEAVSAVKSRNKAVLIQRFAEDRICPAARVQRLADAFGPNAQAWASIPTSPRRPPSRMPPHAVLTTEYDVVHQRADVPPDDPTELALQSVVRFFSKHLKPPA
jgi:dienelactone hydrolase